MKVWELIEQLQSCNSEDIVVMSKDGEGNGYSPLFEVDASCRYEPDSTWHGTTGLRGPLTTALKDRGFSDEDISEGGQDCVVLWPTN